MKTIKEYDEYCRKNNRALIISGGLYKGITKGYPGYRTFESFKPFVVLMVKP